MQIRPKISIVIFSSRYILLTVRWLTFACCSNFYIFSFQCSAAEIWPPKDTRSIPDLLFKADCGVVSVSHRTNPFFYYFAALHWNRHDRSNQHFPFSVSLAVFSADIVFFLQRLHNPLHGCDRPSRCVYKLSLLDGRVLCDQFQNCHFFQ